MRTQRGNVTAVVLFIILVAILAIVYIVWQGQVAQRVATEDKVAQQIQTQGASTETSAIESDLNATSFTSVDSDLSDIETELNTALSE